MLLGMIQCYSVAPSFSSTYLNKIAPAKEVYLPTGTAAFANGITLLWLLKMGVQGFVQLVGRIGIVAARGRRRVK